jgi:DNA-directed RNA polymerase subunit RPC12/RpoP
MFHEPDADPRTGSWECPQCGHKYLFAHWKIKKRGEKSAQRKREVA